MVQLPFCLDLVVVAECGRNFFCDFGCFHHQTRGSVLVFELFQLLLKVVNCVHIASVVCLQLFYSGLISCESAFELRSLSLQRLCDCGLDKQLDLLNLRLSHPQLGQQRVTLLLDH